MYRAVWVGVSGVGLIRDGAIVEGRCRVPLCSGEHASGVRKVDLRLPGKGISNSHGARPVHQITSLIKWIRTSRLSIKISLCQVSSAAVRAALGMGLLTLKPRVE